MLFREIDTLNIFAQISCNYPFGYKKKAMNKEKPVSHLLTDFPANQSVLLL